MPARERIADLGATTWAVNGGATYDIEDFALLPQGRLSLSFHNLGRNAHYVFDGSPGAPVKLPTAVQAGLSVGHATFQNLTARLAVEGRATNGRSPILALGGELDSALGAALRFGYRAGDDIASWSAGAGLRTGGLRIDYAFVPSKLDLADTHRFSLTAPFCGPEAGQAGAGHVLISIRPPESSAYVKRSIQSPSTKNSRPGSRRS